MRKYDTCQPECRMQWMESGLASADWRVEGSEERERCGLKVDSPFAGCLTQFVRPPNWPECIST